LAAPAFIELTETNHQTPSAPKTILVPGGDERLREFVAAEAPVPVEVVSNPSAPLRPSDLAILVVESVDPSVRAAATRVLTDNVPYVVLVRRDVWSVGSDAIHLLLDEVQRDPRRKLIRFWRDRDELEALLRDEVFLLDDSTLIGQAVPDGSFVQVGSSFEQTWELENSGFCVWDGRALKELATEHLTVETSLVPIPRTEPGQRVRVSVRFTAPDEPRSCRSVWKTVDGTDLRPSFPWAAGLWCQVLAVA
jgi:Ig-like domain-containing protein